MHTFLVIQMSFVLDTQISSYGHDSMKNQDYVKSTKEHNNAWVAGIMSKKKNTWQKAW